MVTMPKKNAIPPKEEIPLGQVEPSMETPKPDPPTVETSVEHVRLYGRKDQLVGNCRVGSLKPFRLVHEGVTYERSGVEYGQAVYREVI